MTKAYIWTAERQKVVSITSPPQTYLDLFSLRGRGEEAADFLLSNVMEPAW